MTRSSINLVRLLAPVVAVILCLSATAWLSFRGALQLEQGLDLVQDQMELGELAARLDLELQLGVSKAKNFAILRDELNRERSRDYLRRATKTAAQLLARAPASDGESARFLAETVADVQTRTEELFKEGAHGRPNAEALYRGHLKDITIPFDEASSFYQSKLRQRSETLRVEVARRFRWARASIMASLGVVLGSLCFGLLALLGVGRQLRLALQGLTAGKQP
jgi:hypothetical protein